jgi:hypothetical protein
VSDEDGWICFIPGCFPVLTAGVDHTRVAPVIGSQWFTWHTQDLHFRCVLALPWTATQPLARVMNGWQQQCVCPARPPQP